MQASYLFGADGARSAIVEALGLPIEGHMARAGTVYTVFNADLAHYVSHRPSILNWIVTPLASFGEIGMGLLRAVRPWTQWIAGWGFDISKGDPDLRESTIREGIATMIGDASIEVEIVRTSVWYVNQAYATEYARGRVLCGGDAVHRHPPSSGLGMNTCVQDAFNLAWKLAFVLKGFAGKKLLDSYSLERAPVGKQIVLRANRSRLDYAPLNACFRVAGAPNPVAAGIARLKSRGPDGAAARRALQDALDLKNTEFNAQGVEMNQRYCSGAIVQDPGVPEAFARDKELYVQATTRPGAKIPHAWLIDEYGMRISTLDIVGRGKLSLLTGLSGQSWVEAADALELPLLRTVVIGSRAAQDVYCDWQRIREIDEAGALLVRPDGFIAWRMSAPVHDAAQADRLLRTALGSILDWPAYAPSIDRYRHVH
jgi:2,4-dichlorophenol 6-monooxygenase